MRQLIFYHLGSKASQLQLAKACSGGALAPRQSSRRRRSRISSSSACSAGRLRSAPLTSRHVLQACLCQCSLDPESVAVAVGMLSTFSHAFNGEAGRQTNLNVEVPVTKFLLQIFFQVGLIQSIRCDVTPFIGHCRAAIRLTRASKKAEVSRLQLRVGSVKWRRARHKMMKRTSREYSSRLQGFKADHMLDTYPTMPGCTSGKFSLAGDSGGSAGRAAKAAAAGRPPVCSTSQLCAPARPQLRSQTRQ
jgi:hypothetical protein